MFSLILLRLMMRVAICRLILVLISTLGCFSNDGGDAKENAKKATSLKSTTTILIVQ